ncbi:MAG: ornithine cyclodeaminase family protein [Acidobacteria bacterium]|nr:ornithine cyclodeaminase family protein [Acidobacteriota bacterium]
MALFLKEADVERLLPMNTALRAVEEVFRWHGDGQIINNTRSRVKLPAGFLHLMGGAVPPLGLMGFKAYTVFQGNARFLFCLFNAINGDLLAILEADRLGQIRTGAASGVATKYMARPEAGDVGVIGTGWQARSQLQAVCHVRTVRRVRVWSRGEDHRKRFAAEMSAVIGIGIEAATGAGEAVEGADIIITATTARDPILHSAMVADGAHINAMGSNSLVRRELDEEIILRSSVVAVDSIDQAKLEAGEFLPLVEKGRFHWEQMVELGEIVAGRVPGRRRVEELTCFKSLGVAMEDVVAAGAVYRQALAENWDRRFPLWT